MIYAGTGHRPPKLGGYGNEAQKRLIRFCLDHMPTDTTLIISGMALGFDQALAQAASELGILFAAYIPCREHSSRWPVESRVAYDKLLSKAHLVKINDVPYNPGCMQVRNEMMVNDTDRVLALWNGTSGGTANCIRYARSQNKPIHNLWPHWK